MRDKFFLGISSGLAGSLVMLTLLWLLNLIPGVSIKMINEVSSLFTIGTAGNFQKTITGTIVHLICGSFIGLIMLSLFQATGYSLPLLKGAGLGAITWFFLCGIMARLLSLQMSDTFVDSMLLLLVHIAYGMTTGWFLARYRHTEIA